MQLACISKTASVTPMRVACVGGIAVHSSCRGDFAAAAEYLAQQHTRSSTCIALQWQMQPTCITHVSQGLVHTVHAIPCYAVYIHSGRCDSQCPPVLEGHACTRVDGTIHTR